MAPPSASRGRRDGGATGVRGAASSCCGGAAPAAAAVLPAAGACGAAAVERADVAVARRAPRRPAWDCAAAAGAAGAAAAALAEAAAASETRHATSPRAAASCGCVSTWRNHKPRARVKRCSRKVVPHAATCNRRCGGCPTTSPFVYTPAHQRPETPLFGRQQRPQRRLVLRSLLDGRNDVAGSGGVAGVTDGLRGGNYAGAAAGSERRASGVECAEMRGRQKRGCAGNEYEAEVTRACNLSDAWERVRYERWLGSARQPGGRGGCVA